MTDPSKGAYTVPPWKPDSPPAQDQFRIAEHARRRDPIFTVYFYVIAIAVAGAIAYAVLRALGKI